MTATAERPRADVPARRSSALLDQAVVSGGGFLFTVALARTLDLGQFGLFTLLWMAVLVVNSLHMAAIVMPMATLSGQVPRDQRRTYYRVVLDLQHLFNLVVTVLAVAVWAVGRFFWALELPLLLLLAGASAAYHLQEYYRRRFFCEGRAGRALVVDLLAYGLRFLPLVVGGIHDAQDAVGVVALSYVLACLVAVPLAGPRSPGRRREAWRAHASEQWRLARFLLPSGLLQWLSVNLHMTVAGAVLGVRAVGVVRLGQALTNVGNVYLQALENYLPQRIARWQREDGPAVAMANVQRAMVRAGAATALGGLLLSCFAPQVMALVFGDGFRQHAEIVYWFSGIFVFAVLLSYLRAGLRAFGATRHWFYAYLWSSAVSLATFFPLQSTFGIEGVLAGMVGSYVVLTAYGWWALTRRASMREAATP